MRLLLLLLLVLPSASVFAQADPFGGEDDAIESDPAEETPTTPPVVTPPELLQFVDAVRPAGTETQSAEVLLALTVAADGSVSAAEVVTSGGAAFDEAALAAGRQFRFRPATANGTPVAVRIRYLYQFTAAQPVVRRGALVGTVADGERPIANATVRLAAVTEGETAALRLTVETAADGSFRFPELPPGIYAIEVSAAGYLVGQYEEQVASAEETSVRYRLDPEVAVYDVQGADGDEFGAEGDEFGAEGTIDPPAREVTRRTISREQLTSIPGTRGDALRAVELLPGVGRPSFGSGALLVRGAAATDSQTFFEGVPVPLLYHFGGLTSVVNSRLLEQIDFYPGNFSARFGRKTGGVLDVSFRDPLAAFDDRDFHGVAELSAIDASMLVEFPVGDDAAVALAVRRSTLDLVFEYLIPEDTFTITAAPVYYDYQAFAVWNVSRRDKLRLFVYGAADRFGLFAGDSLSDDDPNIRGNLDLATQFHFAQLGWNHKFDERTELDVDFQAGGSILNFSLGDQARFEGNFYQTYTRMELRHRASDAVRMIVGLDINLTPLTIDFFGPQFGQSEGAQSGSQSLSQQDRVAFTFEGNSYRPGAYFESDLTPVSWLQVILGLRLDYAKEIAEWGFDPRLAALFTVREGYKLKMGVGIFSQPPEFNQSSPVIGNPNLDPIQAAHFGLGFDTEPYDGIRLGIEGFYKQLWDRVVSTQGNAAPFFENAGIGRIYGLEVSGRVDPRRNRNFTGFLSYTLMRSERRDHADEAWRLFDFDQTHIFTLSGTYQLPKHWSVGLTLRLVSGNPTTPIVASIFNPAVPEYQPLPGMNNSARNPLFNRLDVRIEKQWHFESWKLAFFLDLQNAWNASNPEGQVYNYDFTQSVPLNGLPVLPAIGIRGEL